MLRLIRIMSLILAISVFTCLSGCGNDKQYLSDIKVTYTSLFDQSVVCYAVYEEYRSLLQIALSQHKTYASIGAVDPNSFEDIANRMLISEHKRLVKDKPEIMSRLDQNKIDILMKKINKPPKKYQQTYNKLLELYGKYSEVHRFILNPNIYGTKEAQIRLGEMATLTKQLDVMLNDKK